METKEVLLVCNSRKRPLRFQAVPSDPIAERKNLYNAAKRVFSDILSTGEGSSASCHDEFYLQFESEEWGGEMVDVTESVVVPSKAIVYLRKPLSKESVRSCLYHVATAV